MKRLDRNEVANLVARFGNYMAHKEVAFDNGMRKDISKVRRELYEAEYSYWAWCARDMEYYLADMGIFIYGDISKQRYEEWDWEKENEHFEWVSNRYDKAKQAYEPERQEKLNEARKPLFDGAVA